LGAYFNERAWLRLPAISTILDPNSLAGRAVGEAVGLGARIVIFADKLGITSKSLILVLCMLTLLFMLFSIAFLWLLADYRLKRSFMQDEAHQQACIRLLNEESEASDTNTDTDADTNTDADDTHTAEPLSDDQRKDTQRHTLLRKRRYSH